MNYLLLLCILNLLLLSRLRLILRDEGISRKDMWVMGGIPLLVMPFLAINLSWFVLLAYLLVYPLLMRWTERSAARLNRNRGLFLVMHFLVVGLLCSPLFGLQPNVLPHALYDFTGRVLVPSAELSIHGALLAQVALFGLLMVLNEANIVLRYLLGLMGLETLGTKGEEVDQQEYSTGRLIGLLERIFIFLFVMLNQYTAIGFILAAKGVARFQDFKSRTFAEYVLIGTLLSALLAMLVAFVVKIALAI